MVILPCNPATVGAPAGAAGEEGPTAVLRLASHGRHRPRLLLHHLTADGLLLHEDQDPGGGIHLPQAVPGTVVFYH